MGKALKGRERAVSKADVVWRVRATAGPMHYPKRQRPGVSITGHLWGSSVPTGHHWASLNKGWPPTESRETPPGQPSTGPSVVAGLHTSAFSQKVCNRDLVPFGFLSHSLFLLLEYWE